MLGHDGCERLGHAVAAVRRDDGPPLAAYCLTNSSPSPEFAPVISTVSAAAADGTASAPRHASAATARAPSVSSSRSPPRVIAPYGTAASGGSVRNRIVRATAASNSRAPTSAALRAQGRERREQQARAPRRAADAEHAGDAEGRPQELRVQQHDADARATRAQLRSAALAGTRAASAARPTRP